MFIVHVQSLLHFANIKALKSRVWQGQSRHCKAALRPRQYFMRQWRTEAERVWGRGEAEEDGRKLRPRGHHGQCYSVAECGKAVARICHVALPKCFRGRSSSTTTVAEMQCNDDLKLPYAQNQLRGGNGLLWPHAATPMLYLSYSRPPATYTFLYQQSSPGIICFVSFNFVQHIRVMTILRFPYVVTMS